MSITLFEIPGNEVFELPPLLVKQQHFLPPSKNLLYQIEPNMLRELLTKDSVSLTDAQELTLRVMLADNFIELARGWYWGESVRLWIEQCLTTFTISDNLRPIIQPDIWPHSYQSALVTLLDDKSVAPIKNRTMNNRQCLGARLWFRKPIEDINFLDPFCLLTTIIPICGMAFERWASNNPNRPLLPPERFNFLVLGQTF
jgi:hypothetical protein